MTAPASPPANNPALHPPTAHLAPSKPPHSSLPLRTMVVLGTALVLLLAWATVAILLNVSWRDAMNAQIR